MDLFNAEPVIDILPFDGEAKYYGQVLSRAVANDYFEMLLHQIPWKNDEVVIFGKRITTLRKVAWYGDTNFEYTYSNTTKQAHIWTKELLELKLIVEKMTGTTFNSCLLNLYHNGNEGMGWHSDDEKSLGKHNSIDSLSLGAERKFTFKHKVSKQTLSLMLTNGSLLLLQGITQAKWWHSLPKSKKVLNSRVNLTFRRILI